MVERLTSAQVMILQLVGSSPTSGSVLTAGSLEPASDSPSPPPPSLPRPLPHPALSSRSLSKIKTKKKKLKIYLSSVTTDKGHWHVELYFEYGLLLLVTPHELLEVSINRLRPLEGRRGSEASVQPVPTQQPNRSTRGQHNSTGTHSWAPLPRQAPELPPLSQEASWCSDAPSPQRCGTAHEAARLRRRRRRRLEGGSSSSNRTTYQVPGTV